MVSWARRQSADTSLGFGLDAPVALQKVQRPLLYRSSWGVLTVGFVRGTPRIELNVYAGVSSMNEPSVPCLAYSGRKGVAASHWR
jgi:hypothetical protein